MVRAVLLLALLLTMPESAGAAAPESRGARAVAATLHEFLADFENLEWDRFRAHFSDQACVFFPSASTPEEFCGREAVERRFRQEFDSIRRDARSGPPFMRLDPDSLRIEMLGDSSAVATFELHNALRVGRRSIVFRNEGGAWRILHLHASNVPWPDQAR